MLSCLKPYDVFISYAYEDKDIAQSLFDHLKRARVRVWFVGDHIRIGTQITEIIYTGLRRSRYGLVILSKDHAAGSWANYEMRHLLISHAKGGGILPVWHRLKFEEKKELYPELMDIYGPSTDADPVTTASQVKTYVKNKNIPCLLLAFFSWIVYRYRKNILGVLFAVAFAALSAGLIIYMSSRFPLERQISNAADARICMLASLQCPEDTSRWLNRNEVMRLRKIFEGLPTDHSFHEFHYSNGIESINSVSGIKMIGVPAGASAALSMYGIDEFRICLEEFSEKPFLLRYAVINMKPGVFTVTGKEYIEEDRCRITGVYSEPVRVVRVECLYNPETRTRRERVTYCGFMPEEEMLFDRQQDGWQPSVQ